MHISFAGLGENKELSEMLPGILNQLGPDSLNSLKKLAESYGTGAGAPEGEEGGDDDDSDDDDVPDLVENFEEVATGSAE
jgi:nascent polypeptide-associated complex subunit beta